MAVNAAGNPCVTDGDNDLVLELPAGAPEPAKLPLHVLDEVGGVAVDVAGNVYVTSTKAHTVLEMPADVRADRAARRGRGGPRRKCLRHRQPQQPGAETARSKSLVTLE